MKGKAEMNTKSSNARLLLPIGLAVLVAGGLSAEVTYTLGPETELLDAAFYAGQAEDGSDIAGRMAYMGGTSHSGRTVAFLAVNRAAMGLAVFLVDFGEPSSWRRLTVDFGTQGVAPVRWSQDDSHVIVHDLLINVATGSYVANRPFGYMPRYPSVTQLPQDNWMAAGKLTAGVWNIALSPVLSDGSTDFSRDFVIITDWGATAPQAGSWPSISPDGDAVVFQHYVQSATPGVPDTSDVYVLRNVRQILAAPKIPGTDISSLAPTSLEDPNLVPIRTLESANTACAPDFSSDASLVFYNEDFNNQFIYNDFLNTLLLSDFDIMISNADGTASDIAFNMPGNQLYMIPTPSGTRLVYARDTGGVLHLLATTLVVSSGVDGAPVGDPVDNDIITTTPQEVSDASRTTVQVPVDTLINFPPGVPQEFTVTTPLDPVVEPELPPGVDGIPTLREFGPAGTTFDRPVVVTVAYSDAEVARMNESELRVFLYDSGTGQFDIEVTTIVNRDLVNNTISFTIDHFSVYGIGGEFDTDLDGIPDAEDPDDDNDGLADVVDAMPFDTDNDGLDNPVDPDDDDDGLPDVEETGIYHTNPLSPDTDGDGVTDTEEVLQGSDPLDPQNTGQMPAAGVWGLLASGLAFGLGGAWTFRRRRERPDRGTPADAGATSREKLG